MSILQSQLTPQQIAAFQSQTQQYANSPQAVAGIRPGTALLNVNVGNQNVAGLQNVQLLGMCRPPFITTLPFYYLHESTEAIKHEKCKK